MLPPMTANLFAFKDSSHGLLVFPWPLQTFLFYQQSLVIDLRMDIWLIYDERDLKTGDSRKDGPP